MTLDSRVELKQEPRAIAKAWVGVVSKIRVAVKTIIYVRGCNYGMGKYYGVMAKDG